MIYYKIEIFLPEKYIELMIERINNLGACKVGNYDYCASYIKVKGCWRPLESAAPFKGKKV